MVTLHKLQYFVQCDRRDHSLFSLQRYCLTVGMQFVPSDGDDDDDDEYLELEPVHLSVQMKKLPEVADWWRVHMSPPTCLFFCFFSFHFLD